MFQETLNLLESSAEYKSDFIKNDWIRYFTSSILAGALLGFGVFLAITVGALTYQYGPQYKIYMGLSFGIALNLVVMTNSELFTGNNMVMITGLLARKINIKSYTSIFVLSYIGNFIGAIIIAALYAYSGLEDGSSTKLITSITHAKTSMPILTLFLGGMLCNILICLAILFSIKMKNEAAKIIMISWCLFAFITTGYEHCIVNMILFS